MISAPSSFATSRWITAWFAAAYSPIRFIAAQYSWPASLSRSSHASRPRSLYRFGSSRCAIWLYVLQTAAPAPRLPLWLNSATYSPAVKPKLLVVRRQRQHAELDEVVARPARAELLPRRVLLLARDPRDVPVAVHHRVRLRAARCSTPTPNCVPPLSASL